MSHEIFRHNHLFLFPSPFYIFSFSSLSPLPCLSFYFFISLQMTNQIDHMLRDLEKQVHDFTLVNKRKTACLYFTHSFSVFFFYIEYEQ